MQLQLNCWHMFVFLLLHKVTIISNKKYMTKIKAYKIQLNKLTVWFEKNLLIFLYAVSVTCYPNAISFKDSDIGSKIYFQCIIYCIIQNYKERVCEIFIVHQSNKSACCFIFFSCTTNKVSELVVYY